MTYLPVGHGKYIHPSKAIAGYFKLARDRGPEQFLKSPAFQKEREFFIGACFAYGLRKLFKREWYLGAGEEPPDFVVGSSSDRLLTERPFDTISCELVSVPVSIEIERNKLDATRRIISKKFDPKYQPPPGTWLLIFINSSEASVLSEKLRDDLLQQNKYCSVWTINFCHTMDSKFGFEIREMSPGTNASGACVLRQEFDAGVVYRNEFIEKMRRLSSAPAAKGKLGARQH